MGLSSKTELKLRVEEARKSIQQYGSNELFMEFVKHNLALGGKSGLSKSNITKLLKAIEEADTKSLEDYSRKIAEFEDAVNGFVKSRQGRSTLFFGTQWYLYFFYYHPFVPQDAMLGRAVLRINNMGIANLTNVKDGVSYDYDEGRFDLLNDYVMFFDMQGNPKVARLHMKILTGSKPNEISLGAFVSFEHQAVTAGTVVMERREAGEELIPERMSHLDKGFGEIDISIRKYLSLKHMNFLKPPKEVHSLEDLSNFLNRYQINKKRLFFDFDQPQVFISSPTAIKVEDHRKKSGTIKEITDWVGSKLAQINVQMNFHYPGKNHKEDVDSSELVQYRKLPVTNLERLKYTKYFFLIFDQSRVSKSLVELGAALAHCKVVVVFYQRGSGFPESLSTLEYSEQFRFFRMEPFEGSIRDNKDFIQKRIFDVILERLMDSEGNLALT